MSEKSSEQSTRRRLIDAAGQLFAQKGFKETTVRDICDLADANVAAVNYHFGDKEKLYQEVVKYIINNMREKFPIESLIDPSAPAEVRLHTFVHTFIMRRFDPDRPEWQNRLASLEMFNPSSAVTRMLSKERNRVQKKLNQIIEEIIGPPVDPERVMLCSTSIVGQCLIYIFMHGPVSPIPVEERVVMDERMIEMAARHITDFSLAGMERIKKTRKGSSKKK